MEQDKKELINWIANMTLVDAPNDLKTEQSKAIQNLIESKYYAFRDWALKQIETL